MSKSNKCCKFCYQNLKHLFPDAAKLWIILSGKPLGTYTGLRVNRDMEEMLDFLEKIKAVVTHETDEHKHLYVKCLTIDRSRLCFESRHQKLRKKEEC